jgi:UDP-N-acetyl-D-mannosaminuronate dehydrogenase
VLNERGLPVRGARIVLLGVAYKPDIGDTRESPAIKLIELLRRLGADVVYHDEYVPELQRFDLRSLPLPAALDGAAMALIVTAHTGIDYDALARDAECVLDLRGVTAAGAAHVVRL